MLKKIDIKNNTEKIFVINNLNININYLNNKIKKNRKIILIINSEIKEIKKAKKIINYLIEKLEIEKNKINILINNKNIYKKILKEIFVGFKILEIK